jgi:hypothetical protein
MAKGKTRFKADKDAMQMLTELGYTSGDDW